jgi:hypothetical protein
MKFFGIFYLVSFILTVFFANIKWGDHPANFTQRIFCSVLGSFVLTLTFGIWLYGVIAFCKNMF